MVELHLLVAAQGRLTGPAAIPRSLELSLGRLEGVGEEEEEARGLQEAAWQGVAVHRDGRARAPRPQQFENPPTLLGEGCTRVSQLVLLAREKTRIIF